MLKDSKLFVWAPYLYAGTLLEQASGGTEDMTRPACPNRKSNKHV
jgi:hypothetical protein